MLEQTYQNSDTLEHELELFKKGEDSIPTLITAFKNGDKIIEQQALIITNLKSQISDLEKDNCYDDDLVKQIIDAFNNKKKLVKLENKYKQQIFELSQKLNKANDKIKDLDDTKSKLNSANEIIKRLDNQVLNLENKIISLESDNNKMVKAAIKRETTPNKPPCMKNIYKHV